MPLFRKNTDNIVSLIKQCKFNNEKELQTLVENNLEVIFNCKLVATEFSTGEIHAGRIDSLALSEENNPVIIEYKVVESSQLINQSLYYLSWIKDHKGDFQIAVNKSIGNREIDWSFIRVLCIAPGYKKYDLHAVKMMGADIELWEYRYFENGVLDLNEIHSNNKTNVKNISENSQDMIVSKDNSDEYSVDEHLRKIKEEKKHLFYALQEFISSISDDINEVPKKHYIAYKITQNFACVEIHKNEVLIFVKYDPSRIEILPSNFKDVRNLGHFGTGDLEIRIRTLEDLENAKEFILGAFSNING
jgi:predicted transport protein